jgi:hypothetical protein
VRVRVQVRVVLLQEILEVQAYLLLARLTGSAEMVVQVILVTPLIVLTVQMQDQTEVVAVMAVLESLEVGVELEELLLCVI